MMSSHLKMSKPAQSNTSLSSGVQPSVTEYSIRVPKNMKHKHHVMRFNYNLNVDFSQWRNVRMERENNMREFKSGLEEDTPKFGAGSEYNRDQKEEARRKKFGIIAKKYNPDAQPWILKVNSGKSGKKFRGIREGGVSENAAHFIFTQTKDGSIEAFPLNEWYNFQPIQRYKALTAEEAEEEFGRRKKCVNLWSMKMRMKLKNKDEEEVEDPEDKAVKGSKGGDKKKLMISEMDEWMDSDDMSSSGEEEGDGEKKKKEEDSDDEAAKNKKKKAKVPPKKKKKDVDDEAFEESDDGDEEGLERDYISDSSDSESEPEIEKINKELKSVAEEPALQKLLTSDEDSDEEKSEKNEEESDEEKSKKADEVKDSKENDVKAAPVKEKKKEDKKSKMQKFYDAINQKPGTGNASDFSSDSEDSEADPSKKNANKKKNAQKNEKSAHNSRSGTPVDGGIKRKIDITSSDNSNSPQSTPAKKLKAEPISITPLSFSNFSSSKDSFSNTEEAVRRYLMRKPMTTTELLKKIQSKKTGVSSDELVEMMTQILKKINPSRQRIQGKMYLSLKAT